MKIRIALALALMSFTVNGFAKDKAAPPMDAKKQEMMKMMMEAGTPGPSHKILTDMAGKWKYTSKWWETAEAAPQEAKGTARMKMVLGGRFLQTETKGKAMGMPFEGMGLLGYNKITEKYESMWLDNMSTAMMQGTGTFDADDKVLKESGEFYCPMKKKKAQEFRAEWKIIDKDTMTYTFWAPGWDNDDEYKQMELTFKRSGAALLSKN